MGIADPELDVEDLAEWQDGLEEAGVGDPTVISRSAVSTKGDTSPRSMRLTAA